VEIHEVCGIYLIMTPAAFAAPMADLAARGLGAGRRDLGIEPSERFAERSRVQLAATPTAAA
jgi:hypothetical protein